jgi:hypothetical protein
MLVGVLHLQTVVVSLQYQSNLRIFSKWTAGQLAPVAIGTALTKARFSRIFKDADSGLVHFLEAQDVLAPKKSG